MKLAIVMFVLSICAAISYFWNGDWKHGLYWTFAAGITAVVTLMGGK